MARGKRRDGLQQLCFRIEGKRFTVYGRSAKELAEKKQKKIMDIARGIERRAAPTLKQYYDDLQPRRARQVSEATLRTQDKHFRALAEIVIDGAGRKLGELKLAEITAADCRKAQEKLKGSTRTKNDRISYLSFLLKEAVKDELIDRNPCKYVDRIRQAKEKPARETIHRALTENETALFFQNAQKSWYYNLFRLMILTGARIGEIGALTAKDIDSKRGLLRIRRTVTRDTASGYIIGSSTKTAAGVRDIPMNEAIREALREQRQLMGAIGYAFRTEQLFTTAEGHTLREDTVNREIKKICGKAGIDTFTSHAFRATFATRFIEQRPQDYKALSEILGHSSTRITLDLYTHVMQETKAAAMQNITIAL